MFLLMETTVNLQILTQKNLTLRQDTGHSTEDRSSRCPVPGDTHENVRGGSVDSLFVCFFTLAAAVREERI